MPVFSYDIYKTHVRTDNPGYNKTFSSLKRSGLRALLIKHDGVDLAALPMTERRKIQTALSKIKDKYVSVRTYVNGCLGLQVSPAQIVGGRGGLRTVSASESAVNKQLAGPRVDLQMAPLDLKHITGPVNVIYSKCPFWEKVGWYRDAWNAGGKCPAQGSGVASLAACRTTLSSRGRNPDVNLKGFLLECQSILRMIERAREKLQAAVRALQKGNPNLATTTNADLISCKRFWGKLGSNDATRKHWNAVDKNYGAMRAALVPSRSGNQELLRVVESSQAPCGDGNYAFTYPTRHRPPFIWLGEAVFEDVTGNLPPHPGISKAYVRYDNTAMTLLHELSHAVVGTDDVVPYSKHATARVSGGVATLSTLAANAAYPGSSCSDQTVSLEVREVSGSDRLVFATTDIEQLATHRPRWTAVNAHSYACFGAHCDPKCPGTGWS